MFLEYLIPMFGKEQNKGHFQREHELYNFNYQLYFFKLQEDDKYQDTATPTENKPADIRTIRSKVSWRPPSKPH